MTKVKMEKFKDGTGTFVVQIKEAKAVTVTSLVDAVGSYSVDKTEITIVGEVAKTDKGYCLTARGSGAKFSLANREKREEEKEAPNITGKIDEILKDTKTVKVNGVLTADKEKNHIIQLESAEPVKKEERK